MHAIARENLQHFLYSYKESPKEQGLRLIHDAKKSQALRREREHQRALQNLRAAVNLKVAFAVRANSAYDGALEDESPIQKKTISFKKGDFIHIYKRYTHDWWIGRVVAAESTIGFVPTARRLARLTEEQVDEREKSTDKNTIVAREAEIWEYPNPYTVVPSTRPIILLGPCYQSSRLTQLMHAAVRSAIVKKFGSRVRRLTTDIGEKGSSKARVDINERELRLITAMTEDLHLILLECPNISTPGDVAHLNMAPILFLFRISNRKILLKLLKKTGIKGHSAIAGADFLNQLAPDQVDVIIEDNGLHEATNKIFKFLEAYWLALHPTTPILEEEYSEKPPESSGTSDKTDKH
uniref:SH3 domain-containing protein n=1 Tax=Haemonchus contortus TaxID=6289 RepID=A0A7I4XXZ7_HAECO|nr:Src homology-3 and Voltage-dependent calcium channel domain containing protein [Haemonchus contortus]CDJ90731.1 Src homology-3 and Voltage-dependent calcium channel domain containing protein [Haemonchus contortus]